MNLTIAATTHVRRGSRAAPSSLSCSCYCYPFPECLDVPEADGGRWRLKTDSADGLALVGLGEGVDRPYEPGLPRRGCCLDVVAFRVPCSFSWTSGCDISVVRFRFRFCVWTLRARLGPGRFALVVRLGLGHGFGQTWTRTDLDSDRLRFGRGRGLVL